MSLDQISEEQRKVEKYINEKNLKYTGYEKELNYIEKKIKNELTRIKKLENDSTLLSHNIIFLRNQEDQCKNELSTIQEKISDENRNFTNLKKDNIDNIENKFENLSMRILKKKEEEKKLDFDNKIKLNIIRSLEQQEIDLQVLTTFIICLFIICISVLYLFIYLFIYFRLLIYLFAYKFIFCLLIFLSIPSLQYLMFYSSLIYCFICNFTSDLSINNIKIVFVDQ